MDEQLRRQERLGATGDPEAAARAIQHELRTGHWVPVTCRWCYPPGDRTAYRPRIGCQNCDGYGYVRVKLEDLLPLRRREPKSHRARLEEMHAALQQEGSPIEYAADATTMAQAEHAAEALCQSIIANQRDPEEVGQAVFEEIREAFDRAEEQDRLVPYLVESPEERYEIKEAKSGFPVCMTCHTLHAGPCP